MGNALAEDRTIPASSAGQALWTDEPGFYLLPVRRRRTAPWAPVAQTPVIRRKLSYDHLSAISAISLTGDLYREVQDHSYQDRSYKGADVIGFLEQWSRVNLYLDGGVGQSFRLSVSGCGRPSSTWSWKTVV